MSAFPHGVEEAFIRFKLNITKPLSVNPEAPHQRKGYVDFFHSYSNLWVEIVRWAFSNENSQSQWPHWAGRVVAWTTPVWLFGPVVGFTLL